MLLSEIISGFEKQIPLNLQEKWDHCGLNLGSPTSKIKSVLFSYDICLEVLAHAKRKKCNLIVTHHPFRMSSEVNIRTDSYEGRIIEYCLKNGIALYSSHTNHDASAQSLNFHYLNKLGVKNIKPLAPVYCKLYKLVVYTPKRDSGKVLDALFRAGAGQIGNYGECSFRTSGTGTFKGGENTSPAIGKKGVREEVAEERLETIVKETDLGTVISAMRAAHPYEEVAYDIFSLENKIENNGIGAWGHFELPMTKSEALDKIKELFEIKSLRFVNGKQKSFKTVGIVTGSGTSFLKHAFARKLDLFITGDVKYHQAIEAKRHDLSIADVGHFHSEKDSILILQRIFKDMFGRRLVYHTYSALEDAFDTI